MSYHKVDNISFNRWKDRKFIEYSAERIAMEGSNSRTEWLCLCANLNGIIQVSLGDKVLYEGNDFDVAASIYHSKGEKYPREYYEQPI
jgi:hypothetical protein